MEGLSPIQATRELADFVARTRTADLPAVTLDRAARVFADTVGVVVHGGHSAEVRALADQVEVEGVSVLLCHGFRRGSTADAALVNGVSSCRTELDEATRPTGHPAIHIVPVALAKAQEIEASGAALLTAVVLGYEVHARIQRAAGHLREGVHCHGNVGHAAAAAALGKLTESTSSQICQAINAASSFASATSYELPLAGASVHAATPATSGLIALMVEKLIASGFTAHEGSVANVFGRLLGERFDPRALVEGLGDGFAIDQNYVKFHATCGHAHAVLDAIGDALGGIPRATSSYPWRVLAPFAPTDIERVEVRVSERAASLAGMPRSPVSLAARFSIPFAAAAYLVHGHASAEVFDDPLIQDRRVWDVAARVRVQAEPLFDRAFPATTPAEVEILLNDGRRYVGTCANAYGNPVNEATADHVREKFLHLTGTTIGNRRASQLWDASIGLGALENTRGFPGFSDDTVGQAQR